MHVMEKWLQFGCLNHLNHLVYGGWRWTNTESDIPWECICAQPQHNVTIEPDTIVAAGTLVNNDIGEGVYAGVPARYICSLDEFIKKRRQYPQIRISRGKGGLSEETITACWKRFEDMEKSK